MGPGTARCRLARRGRAADPRPRQVLFDVAVTLCVAGASLLPLSSRMVPRVIPVIGLLMAAALLVRRRWPLAVMGVVSALALAQVLLGSPAHEPMAFDVAVVIAMYSVVKYARPLWHAFAAAAVVATGIVIEMVRHESGPGWALGAVYVTGCGAIWLAGYTVRVRRLYVAQLEERAATAERERDHLARLAMADERAGIARELHDIVAHGLAVMIVQADGAGYALDSDPQAARGAIGQIAATGRESLTEMRRLVGLLRGDLHPEVTRHGSAAPEPGRRVLGARALDELLDRARTAGLRPTLIRTGEPRDVPAGVDLALYRIVQEALTNALRHAGGGANVRVEVAYAAGSVRVDVRDDGGIRVGPAGPAQPPGHGLIGMRERVGVYGGQFRAGPDGAGWWVSATLPWSTATTANTATTATTATSAGAAPAASGAPPAAGAAPEPEPARP